VSCSLTYDETLSRVRIDADGLCVTGYADTFSRSVTGGWGTADSGGTWTVVGDVTSNYSVTGGVGRHNGATENVFYNSVLNVGSTDCDYKVTFASDKLAAGTSQIVEAAGRFTDINNLYTCRALLQTNQVIVFDMRKRVAGVQTVIGSGSVSLTHAANTQFTFRLQIIGTSIRAKLWRAIDDEPSSWIINVTDTSLTTGSNIALRSFVPTGTSNEPIIFSWDNLSSVAVDHAIVDRTTDSVTYVTVRGASDVGVTTGCELERVVDDYEFPVGQLITYRVRSVTDDGTILTTSTCQIQVDLDDVWLKSIGRPFLNRILRCVGNPSPITRRARNGIFPIVGRSFPVAVTDVRGSRELPLRVVTQTTQERQDLDLVLASGDPVFLQVPAAHPLPTMYAVIDDSVESRPVRNRDCDNDWRLWELPLIEVAAPGPDVVGSTSTWQTVISTYATWADVLAAHDTWASVLELIGDPTEVIVP
jgi:hypothetical protein